MGKHYDVFYYSIMAESDVNLTLRRVWCCVYACSLDNRGVVPRASLVAAILGLSVPTVTKHYRKMCDIGWIDGGRVVKELKDKGAFVWRRIGMGDACELMYSFFWGLSKLGADLVEMPAARLITFYGAPRLKRGDSKENSATVMDIKTRIYAGKVLPVLHKLKKAGLIERVWVKDVGWRYKVHDYEKVY